MRPALPKQLLWIGLLLVAIAGTVWWLRLTRDVAFNSEDEAAPSGQVSQELAARLATLEAQERHMAETVWAKEVLAQECGRTFEDLWDSVNAATNKLALIAAFPVGEITLGRWTARQQLPHGIELRQSVGSGPRLSAEGWRGFVEEFARAGWQLEQIEFRHRRFDPDDAGQPMTSRFYCAAHLTNPKAGARAVVEGDLEVAWGPPLGEGPGFKVRAIDARGLALKTRQGEPPFQPILAERIEPLAKAYFIDPLLVYDLDGDGLSEIILAGKNLVYRRQPDDHYAAAPLCRHPPGVIDTAVIADFDGDGAADFLCANSQGLWLYRGSPQGAFEAPAQLAWRAEPRLANGMVLTCGDIDGDGDLDAFLGQYLVPTLGQILRPSYYDANDGHPAYLLRNDGRGNFTDVTADAGLAPKRHRRVFSASFVDLDADGDLDLLVVSDFAGVDLYANDGHGLFRDVTGSWVGDPHGFGMSHTLADFNRDGQLDFLMIGMNSPTVDRLEHLGLQRPHPKQDPAMRRRMTFGNRLFLARAEGGFEQTPLNDALAQTGWSWGCTAADFDNDGWPDVFIANGHESHQSVRDYEPEFWLHDLYVDESVDDLTATGYFLAKQSRTRGRGWSYGGYEKNRLYLNLQGQGFLEVGYLMGVALEADSRGAVADDLDGDGRVDLLVTTFEVWPEVKQTLRVYRNTLGDGGNWIGFRLREAGAGKSPVGARVILHCGGRPAVRQLVTGDSLRAQHANTIHFGLGKAAGVEEVEIKWPHAPALFLSQPAVNQYHQIAGSSPPSPAR
jgi:hypothetical protein